MAQRKPARRRGSQKNEKGPQQRVVFEMRQKQTRLRRWIWTGQTSASTDRKERRRQQRCRYWTKWEERRLRQTVRQHWWKSMVQRGWTGQTSASTDRKERRRKQLREQASTAAPQHFLTEEEMLLRKLKVEADSNATLHSQFSRQRFGFHLC